MTKKLLTFLITTATIINLFGIKPALATNPPVLITEVQTGFTDSVGVESPRQEFIELTNVSTAAVNLTNWRLEYLSAANDGSGAPTLLIDTLNGQISLNGHGMWEHEGYYPIAPDSIFGVGDVSSSGLLAKSGGHLRLMNGTTMIDCVSWGSAVVISGCDKVSAVAGPGYTIQRRLTNGAYDKSTGVANLTPATPQGNNIYALTVTPPVTVPPTDSIQPTPMPNCDGIQLSEILANPAGDDAQGEFIEIYNPLDHDQALYGCSLRMSNGKEYAFSAVDSINSHQYEAFPYSATGLQLNNSGSTVTLVTASQQVSTTYPAVGDDEAWVLVDGNWSSSDMPTPNAANVLTQPPVVNASTAAVTLVAALECPAGKYRNPATNRCRNIIAPTPIMTCTVGQERNPATGRCRKLTAAASPTPCQVGQERNPDTGRCRKIQTVAAQKPCDPGQERNADTGRCRKVTSTPGGKVLGATTVLKRSYHYILVFAVLAIVISYGIYEYRRDALSVITRLKKRWVTS